MEYYIFWKTAHVISAAVILGTGVGIAFFCWFGYRSALRSGDIGVLRTTLRLTVIADACFTAPAVAFQVVSGLTLMRTLGWPFISKWFTAVAALFIFVGACWLPVLVIQASLSREALEVESIGKLPAAFHQRFRLWLILGVPTFAAVLLIYYLMIAKPLGVMKF